MNELLTNFVPEPERYELRAGPVHHFELARRDFFKLLGAGIAIFTVAKDAAALQESGRARRAPDETLPNDITSWLHVAEDGTVTAFTGKVEIGQNIRTSLAQSVADELRVPFESVRMVMGDTFLTPFDQGTFGSRTTPTMTPQLRRVASAARDLLVEQAAQRWNVSTDKLVAADAKVTDPASGKSLRYAQLTAGQSLARTLPDADPVTPPPQWTIAGKAVPKVDARAFVTGKHQYTTDLRPPNLLYGKVLRAPSFGASLTSVDISAAQQQTGVTVVRDGNFVAAAAPSERAADKALAAIHAEWKSDPQPSAAEIFTYLKQNAEPPSGERDKTEKGSVKDGLATAAHHLEETYNIAYIAHAPLEPRAAVAEWSDDKTKLTVWTGTQRPFGVRDELSDAFHLPHDHVRVIVPDTGAAYGGKHTGDAALEAARLARAANRPVKIVWTREEEFTWAYFRPAGVIEIKSGIAADGTLTAWEFHNYNSGSSGIATPYAVPNQLIQFHYVKSPLRQGSYRGLAATANHFARESHMDGLARAAQMDSLEFRLKNLADDRLRAVFQAAAKSFGWPRAKKQPGQGFGMGGGLEKGGYVATFAEVAVDPASGSVRVVRINTAFECGAIVNPDGLRHQVLGANIMGLGGALFEAINFENGHILNARFSRYRVPRFRDIPEIDVVLVDRKDIPSAGAGETPLVGLAPAIGNAICDATGTRLRNLPLAPNGIKA
ncbi:MAG TPA: molybdopterin cofactor-binding domain-containing protein [Candidatus Acidoferrum sp.]|jgi:isoquinoline 1-oxidoreductase